MRGRRRCFNTPSVGPNLSRLRQPEFRTLFPKNCLPRKLDAVPFNRKDLHQNLIALAQLILDLLHAMLRDLGDVQQAIGPREDLHERPELSKPNHLT